MSQQNNVPNQQQATTPQAPVQQGNDPQLAGQAQQQPVVQQGFDDQGAPLQRPVPQEGVDAQAVPVQQAQTNQAPANQAPVGQGNSNQIKDPEDWVTGDQPMTGAQRSYLDTLAKQAGETLPANLSKAEASEHIERLQQVNGTPTQQPQQDQGGTIGA